MRGNRMLVTILLGLSMAAMLLGGLIALPPQISDEAAAPETADRLAQAAQEITEDEVVLLGRRRPGHPGIKARMSWFVLGGHVIAVDVNPTLAGGKS